MSAHEQLIKAVQRSARQLASGANFDETLRNVLATCVDAVGAQGGTIYVHEAAQRRLRFQHVLPEEVADRMPVRDLPDDYGLAGEAFPKRTTVRRDFPEDRALTEFENATGVRLRSMIATPLMMEDEEPLGVVQLINKIDGTFTDADASVLDTISAVATMAYLNSRLVEETSRSGSLLGMGKVSHDIGNLAASLYANLSFSDMAMSGLRDHLHEGADSETLNMYADTIDEMFRDLRASVDRIVGYSRLISDLSAGRELRPNMQVAPMSETIRTSAAYLESEGRKSKVGLRYEIEDDAPATAHDGLYLFRIVQNLVGNAIKAVRQTIPDEWLERAGSDEDDAVLGEVTIRYRFCPDIDGKAEHWVEVQDTGPGMSEDVAERILSGTARSMWEKGGGSGWGTKIVLELAATHGGVVEIDSAPGQGATFRVRFPHQPA